MILLKGFFRKNTTKIYLFLFSTLLIIIVILFSFINYYIYLRDDYFKNNSYILAVSKNDCYSNIIKQNIIKVEKVLLFEPDYSSNIIQNQELSESGKIRNDLLYWSDIIIGNENSIVKRILVIPKDDLDNNQINIGVSSEKMGNSMASYDSENIVKALKTYNLSFYYNGEKLEYKINNIYINAFSEIQISSNKFQKLYNDSNVYAYKITVGNEKKAKKTIENLEISSKNASDVYYLKKNIFSTDSAVYKTNQIITALKCASIIILAILSLIFLIIISNIIKDEYENIKIESLLGFKRKEIMKYLCVQLFTLCTVSLLVCAIFSSLIIFLLNYICKLELTIFNPFLLLVVFSAILFLSLLAIINSTFKLSKHKKCDIITL